MARDMFCSRSLLVSPALNLSTPAFELSQIVLDLLLALDGEVSLLAYRCQSSHSNLGNTVNMHHLTPLL